jgi:hypothetical protein
MKTCWRLFSMDLLESRRLLSASPTGDYSFNKANPLQLVDADGTVATFNLKGAGQGQMHVADDGWRLELSATKASSNLTIGCAGGDGVVTLSAIHSPTALNLFSAAAVNLSGPADLTAKSIVLGNLVDASIASTAPIKSLSLVSWQNTDANADTLIAPAIGNLKIAGDFAANVLLNGGQGTVLKSASIAGELSGSWVITGNAGTLNINRLRGSIDILGDARSTTLGDHVAVISVPSSTGGTIHIHGKGKFDAAGDSFQVQDSQVYTCGEEMYSYAEVTRFDQLGEVSFYAKNGKPRTSTIEPNIQQINGHDAYISHSSSGTNIAFGQDDQGFLMFHITASKADLEFDNLHVGPPRYTLGSTFSSDSPGTMSLVLNPTVTASTEGHATYTRTFLGHELVRVAAGIFLAPKFQYTLTYIGSGHTTGGSSVELAYTESNIVWDTPSAGTVRQDAVATLSLTSLRTGKKISHSGRDHYVLVQLPVVGG